MPYASSGEMFRGRHILEGRSATTMGLKVCADTIIESSFGRLVPFGSVESPTVAIIDQRSICSSMCSSSYIRVLRCLHTSMRVTMAKCRLVSNRPLSASEGIHLGGRSVRITRGSDDEGSDDDSGGSWRIVATAE